MHRRLFIKVLSILSSLLFWKPSKAKTMEPAFEVIEVRKPKLRTMYNLVKRGIKTKIGMRNEILDRAKVRYTKFEEEEDLENIDSCVHRIFEGTQNTRYRNKY